MNQVNQINLNPNILKEAYTKATEVVCVSDVICCEVVVSAGTAEVVVLVVCLLCRLSLELCVCETSVLTEVSVFLFCDDLSLLPISAMTKYMHSPMAAQAHKAISRAKYFFLPAVCFISTFSVCTSAVIQCGQNRIPSGISPPQ